MKMKGDGRDDGGRAVAGDAILQERLTGFVHAMWVALEARDAETMDHSRRVTTYTLLLAERMGIDRSKFSELAIGAALHDVGKIGIPDHILRKPGRLSEAEWERVREHPVIGATMLRSIAPHLPSALDLVLHHHERFDGRGYPHGLQGEKIALPARMFAVVDAFDAMINDRPYRRATSIERAMEELQRERRSHLCPMCVDAFAEIELETLCDVRKGAVDCTDQYLGRLIINPFAKRTGESGEGA